MKQNNLVCECTPAVFWSSPKLFQTKKNCRSIRSADRCDYLNRTFDGTLNSPYELNKTLCFVRLVRFIFNLNDKTAVLGKLSKTLTLLKF